MRILWHSNAAWTPTGYGNQTAVFTRLLRDAGHEVLISAFYGLDGAVLGFEDMTVLPTGRDMYGNDMLKAHYDRHGIDLVITLVDAWVLAPHVLQKMPVMAWAPVDSEPIPQQVVESLKAARWPAAYSRFGEKQMQRAGLNPLYIPHGIDTKTYYPDDRAAAREAWSVPDDAFFVVMVAANKGYPPRKSFDRILKAWRAFSMTHPDAILYMHTMPTPHYQGVDLVSMVKFYNLEDNVRFADTEKLIAGGYKEEALRKLYNAADVLLSPSMGEGFGLPVVEAQACGCPVIVSDFSAQSELCFAGYKIPVRWQDRVWTYQGSEQAQVPPSEIIKSLEWAHEQRDNKTLRRKAHEGAQQYDAGRIFADHFTPALARIEAEIRSNDETTLA